jgi:hypothetical protein
LILIPSSHLNNILSPCLTSVIPAIGRQTSRKSPALGKKAGDTIRKMTKTKKKELHAWLKWCKKCEEKVKPQYCKKKCSEFVTD